MDYSVLQATPDPYQIVYAVAPTPGALGVIARKSRLPAIQQLQEERIVRQYKVRGIISDYIPLAGSIEDILARIPQNCVYLNENPLSIYLHRGGHNAVYYDFVGDADNKLQYIEVIVETILPSDALLLARGPLNEMLDTITRSWAMPLVLQRLDIISPIDGEILAHEIIIPFPQEIRMGPLGGIHQIPTFAPYDALFREAIITTSPFYRLLCAFRMYEGLGWIRRWTRDQCKKFGINERLPGDPPVDVEELKRLGFSQGFIEGINTANDLFNKLKDHRNSIAHFLLRREESHVYLSKGESILEYSLGSAILLRYAREAIQSFYSFYKSYLADYFMRGSILPELRNRHRFVIRNSSDTET